MASFNQSYKMQNATCILEFTEPITDKFVFPTVQGGIRTIEIDLAKVTFMSSFGVKLWIEWHRRMEPGITYLISNASPPFVNNINMVDGFLPKQSKVLSLYAPFISEDGDTDELVLLTLDKDYFADGKWKLPLVKTAEGVTLSEDFFPEKYFKFLRSV